MYRVGDWRMGLGGAFVEGEGCRTMVLTSQDGRTIYFILRAR
jgi:hypothetical protein